MIALPTARAGIATTPEVLALVRANSPVAIGVSGGKDSCAVAIATIDWLNLMGHSGPRILVHADLGVTEWKDSLPTCRRLAHLLDLELVIVRRPQGDMMDRWEQRWRDNLRRYMELSCVKLILPWSTPAMRFCTAELKVDQITRYLSKRFPGTVILNVTGIRRQESDERAKAAVAKPEKKLTSITNRTTGLSWNPIIDWQIEQVWESMAARGFEPHEAYTLYGASRVSCCWCILATKSDHQAAAIPPENLSLGRRMVDLEITSTFGFQGNRWLGDTLADLLTPDQRDRWLTVKVRAETREYAEAKIPKHLLYTKGWPTCIPTRDEATLLGAVRFAVADAVGFSPTFTNPDQIISRYTQLMRLKEARPVKRVKS